VTEPADRPNRIPWPPILFLGALLAANALRSVWPLSFDIAPMLRLFGGFVAVSALGTMAWAFLAFRAHQTSVLPHRRADALIETGPFAFSRNPIYLSEALLLAGLGLVNGSVWYWLVIPVFMLAVTRLAIAREEAHLQARFGPAWQGYATRVRRWL
jgi:protein-S-isoprenylcysteine O-methyltransferase Ste14